MAVGATFFLVGILGFVPGVTQNYDAMELAGHNSGAELGLALSARAADTNRAGRLG